MTILFIICLLTYIISAIGVWQFIKMHRKFGGVYYNQSIDIFDILIVLCPVINTVFFICELIDYYDIY